MFFTQLADLALHGSQAPPPQGGPPPKMSWTLLGWNHGDGTMENPRKTVGKP